ncbi:alpha/beta hydrolase, putative [Plasmodium berghei]|uniref:Alpha/beta hydrolase, putative n=2 Tax=Plasmodium berghei TaxID=5821 RepID=A0A509AHC3_PLABA|nr:alpha/beta hydrolase, putative [Plasmodium berghei ANKA]CXH89724.1 alpha/beta hydrolase, putative [Plasmodium berghei]SCL90361.1 alpha/beta hydrolase, putative [Plasmodium berghei]SCM15279.1 alpha/beta hydrolase, putative [Plasmodium berghei]SCM17074.1 alpha/beta hydrolase, putative [Plasmodium berghei]SCN21979.1 alpha/beta hydrolase, putative [Plasmodium berghei]|eukprot:XP_034419854.1 alpha/beta hydrolase, putative [Plasmodium berghei ANKA]
MGSSLSSTALFRPTSPSYEDDLKNLIYIPELLHINPNKYLENKQFEIFNKDENIKELSKRKFPALFFYYSKKLKTKHTIMYFHSNSCDLGQIYEELYTLHEFLHVNILAIEYVGFGLSYLEGTPNQYNINRRALAAYNFLKSLNLNPENIILFGRSIGTGVATKLAHNVKIMGDNIGGIILHSPYISIEKLVEDYVSYSSYLIENIYDNFKNLTILSNNDDSDAPFLLIHGKDDEVINASHSEYLIKNLNNKFKSSFYPEDSSHNCYYVIDDIAIPTKNFLCTLSKSRHQKKTEILLSLSYLRKELEIFEIRKFGYKKKGQKNIIYINNMYNDEYVKKIHKMKKKLCKKIKKMNKKYKLNELGNEGIQNGTVLENSTKGYSEMYNNPVNKVANSSMLEKTQTIGDTGGSYTDQTFTDIESKSSSYTNYYEYNENQDGRSRVREIIYFFNNKCLKNTQKNDNINNKSKYIRAYSNFHLDEKTTNYNDSCASDYFSEIEEKQKNLSDSDIVNKKYHNAIYEKKKNGYKSSVLYYNFKNSIHNKFVTNITQYSDGIKRETNTNI